MNQVHFKHKFSRNQTVYHVLDPESCGVVLAVRYMVDTNEVEYLISLSMTARQWVLEEELTDEKPIDLY